MVRRPPRSKLTASPSPYLTPCRSAAWHLSAAARRHGGSRSRGRRNRRLYGADGALLAHRRQGLRPYLRRRLRGVLHRAAGTMPADTPGHVSDRRGRSEEHTSELKSLMSISYAVFGLTNTNNA